MSGDHRRSRPRSVGLRISHSVACGAPTPAHAPSQARPARLGSPFPEAAQDAKLTEAERAELVELLLKSEREFRQELEGVNERQWSFKLGPDRWSVGEVVEHIVLADGLLFATATNSLTRPPDAQWDATLSKTETLRRALPDRSRRVDAPGAIQPRRAMPRE